MIKKPRNQPYAPKWSKLPNGSKEEEEKKLEFGNCSLSLNMIMNTNCIRISLHLGSKVKSLLNVFHPTGCYFANSITS
jgi:hypothetical protein